KLVRRHPHVFGDTKVENSAQVLANWEVAKAAEKGRRSAIDGVPLAQPALPLVAKLLYRAEKFNYEIPINQMMKLPTEMEEDQFGQLLLGLIAQAVSKGLDPEAALRGAAKSLIAQIQAHETR
ncbi:MAG: hypothetical protein RJB29_944, partial [Actinomycetota bacterium]